MKVWISKDPNQSVKINWLDSRPLPRADEHIEVTTADKSGRWTLFAGVVQSVLWGIEADTGKATISIRLRM